MAKIEQLIQAKYEDVLKHCEEKALNHKYYKFYTSEDRVKNILGKCGNPCGIYLGSGINWNDKVDREKFNSNSEKVNFALCLSFSKTESIAMWMLYGGMKKKGMMIDFNQGIIKAIKNYNGEIKLGKFDNNGFISKPLQRDQYEIDVFDIVYKSIEVNSKAYYRSDDYFITDSNIGSSGFHNIVKTYGWKYENEVRIVATIKKELVEDGYDTVFIPFEEDTKLYKRVYYSPNFEGNKDKQFKPSYYTDKMDWDLCGGCDKAATIERK